MSPEGSGGEMIPMVQTPPEIDEDGVSGDSTDRDGFLSVPVAEEHPECETPKDLSNLLMLPRNCALYGTFHETGGDGATPHSVTPRKGCCSGVMDLITKLCAVLIAAFITVVDNLPYGLLIFPPSFELNAVGVQLVLFSAAISQVVYSFMSAFPCALGSMIIENVVFLHAMSLSISRTLRAEGNLHAAFPTIVYAMALSTVLTGITFFLLGALQLGKISSYFPRPVLLGVIGGMGMFIATEGIGIATGVPWGWDLGSLRQQLQLSQLIKLTVTVSLTAGLSLMQYLCRHALVMPLYFLCIPALFFAILHATHVSVSDAQNSGWLFSFKPPQLQEALVSSIEVVQSCKAFPGALACLAPWHVAWHVIPDQLFTMISIVFFSVIHVPVNVPALAATTGCEADLNRELRSHGVSNLVAGLLLSSQNYMAYSTSALYYKTGGGGRFSGIMVAALIISFLSLGPNAITYFPRPLAGCLLVHIGGVLLWESLVAPWRQWVDTFEYIVIVTITASMMVIGFMNGVGIGLLLACGLFVVQCSRVNPIQTAYPGDGLRSKEMRSGEQRKLLDFRLQGAVYIIRLRGALFFGNVDQLFLHVMEVLSLMPGLSFLMLDCTMLVSADCHARERLSRLCKIVTEKKIKVVWSSLTPALHTQLQKVDCFEPLKWHHHAKNLNTAFSYCEDCTLELLHYQDTAPGGSADAAPFLKRVLRRLTSESDDVLDRLEAYYVKQSVTAGTVIWRRNDPSTFAVIVETGMLAVPRSSTDPSYSASLAQQSFVRHGRTHQPWPYRDRSPSISQPTDYVEYSLPGQMSGELGLFTRENRKYTFVAVQDSVIWRIDMIALNAALQKDSYMYIVMQKIALRYASHRLNHLMLAGQLHSI